MPETLAVTFDELLAPHHPEMRSLARKLRALVKAVAPQAHEAVHAGWGGHLLFRHGTETGNTVCHLSVHRQHVSLGMAQGSQIPDPTGLLQGSGKHSRHLKLKSAEELQNPAVRALIEAAWSLQPDARVLEAALARVRNICLALPHTSETVSHGHPTFWAGKKTFAVFGLYSASVAFKASFEMHTTLDGDPRFFPTPYLASAGWLSVKLDADTDWDLVTRLLQASYEAALQKPGKTRRRGPASAS